jgi:hypothetical protein
MPGVWVTWRQYMTRKMSGGGWRDSSRVTCLLTLRKVCRLPQTRVPRMEPGKPGCWVSVRVLPDQGGCRFDGEEKEGCTVIGRHRDREAQRRWRTRSQDGQRGTACCCWRGGGVCICSAGEREGDGWSRCHGQSMVSIYACSVGPASRKELGWSSLG